MCKMPAWTCGEKALSHSIIGFEVAANTPRKCQRAKPIVHDVPLFIRRKFSGRGCRFAQLTRDFSLLMDHCFPSMRSRKRLINGWSNACMLLRILSLLRSHPTGFHCHILQLKSTDRPTCQIPQPASPGNALRF